MKNLLVLALIPLLALCSCVPAYSAPTTDHFIQGFLLTGYSASIFSRNHNMVLYSAIVGGVVGALPYIIGCFGPHHSLDWPYYSWSHLGTNPLRFLPPYGLHLLVDKAFHRFPGDNWWPRMVGACVVMWIGEGILTYLFFKYVLPTSSSY
jgi:hypothetical protein